MAHEGMSELPWDLARRDLLDDAIRVADAFAEIDDERRSQFASDAALLLAEAGRAEEACARAEESLRAFPRDLWTRVHAGDVHRTLGDAVRAEQEFRHAAELASATGSPEDVAVAAERIARLLADQPGRERDAEHAAALAAAAERGQRVITKVGRNDPCPCGSGRKHKKCCGS